jgi:hypothetical protein
MSWSFEPALICLLTGACTRESAREKLDTTVSAQHATVAQETPSIPVSSTPSETVATAGGALSIADSSGPGPLICSPITFAPGDTLTLRMWTPHGHYLTVTRSDRIAYFIVYSPLGKSKPTYSLLPSDDFARLGTLRLPSDIRAIPYVYERDTILESVFSEPGKYLLQMADNLGTDYGPPPASCNLTFVKGGSQ